MSERPPEPPPTAQELAALQAVLDHSTRTAGESVAVSLAAPARQMSAAEVVEFWRSVRLFAMTTVGSAGQPHTAPVHARLRGARIDLVIYDDTVRRADLRTNPRVSFSTWNGSGAALIAYGRAREVAGSLRDARPAQTGKARRVVAIEVELTRVYAMRAPAAG
jgi:pyridoxamine 5'-phosphate oxidase-like protein